MITINEHGERIPNIGEFKGDHFPYVMVIENENDRTLINDWMAEGSIKLKNKWRDKVDGLTHMLVFDDNDGMWTEIDGWQMRAVSVAIELRRINRRKERS